MNMTVSTTPRKLMPLVDSVNKPFWDSAAQHVLKIQRCSSCGHHQYPPIVFCPKCADELEWETASGRATLYTFTVIRRIVNPAFEEEVPYNVSIVQLEEGPLLLSNVVGVDVDDLVIGMPLDVTYDDIAEGVSLPKFKPAAA